MLLIIAWSAVMLWINVRPRILDCGNYSTREPVLCWVGYGWPWPYAWVYGHFRLSHLPQLRPSYMWSYWALAGNGAIGALAVAALTRSTTCLLRRLKSRFHRDSECEMLDEE